MKVEKVRCDDLLRVMKQDQVSTPENVEQLKKELAEFYEETEFLDCTNMGELVELSLEMLTRKPDLYKEDKMSG